MAIGIKPRTITRLRTPLFVSGIALALVAFVAMFAIGSIFFNRSAGPQTAVVVAAQDIEARAPITASMLTISRLPANALPPRAFASVSELSGYSAVVTILKGEAITSNLVASSPDQLGAPTATYLPIPQGFIAMTLPTNEQQGVAGYVAQGDYIDVIATVNTALLSTVNPRMVTRTVFTNVRVIRVGPPSAAPKQGQVQGVSSSVTVVISLCDAQYLEWLIINATLKYALLSYHDYGTETPASGATCPSTSSPGPVGPAQIDTRWAFTKG